MSDPEVKIEWNGEELAALLGEVTEDLLNAIVLQAEGIAKAKFDTVDTGFARNAITALLVGSNGKAPETKSLHSRKTGKSVKRRSGKLPAMKEDEAALAGAAEYHIWLEIRKPDLARALQQALNEAAGIAQDVAKKHGLA